MTVLPGKTTSLTVPAQPQGYTLTLDFGHSTDGGATLQEPIVFCPVVTDLRPGAPIVISSVASEDSKDNDANDTEVTIIFDGVS